MGGAKPNPVEVEAEGWESIKPGAEVETAGEDANRFLVASTIILPVGPFIPGKVDGSMLLLSSSRVLVVDPLERDANSKLLFIASKLAVLDGSVDAEC